jgi:hypothetical protein
MIARYPFAALFFLTTACVGAELPPRYQDLQCLFHEAKPYLLKIERELANDDLWQLVPHYVDGTVNEPHFPELTSDQLIKYKDLLELVPDVSYVDHPDDQTEFSLGSVTIDRWSFIFQYVHTTRRARPVNCDEISLQDAKGICSSDLGDDWALYVGWYERADRASE